MTATTLRAKVGGRIAAAFVLAGLSLPIRSADGQAAPGIAVGYEREVNRYRWTADLDVRGRVGDWQVQAVNRFASDAFVLFDNRLSFRDEERFRWATSGPRRGAVAAGFRGETLWFSQSRVLQQTVSGVLPVVPTRWLTLEPALGIALDQRPGAIDGNGFSPLRRDAGPLFGGRVLLRPDEIQGYRMQFAGDANLQVIAPRRGRQLRVDGTLEKQFDQTRFATRASYGNVRRDAYQSVSFLNRDAAALLPETVEATTSDTLSAGIEIGAPIASGLTLHGKVDLGANNRLIRTYGAPTDALFFDTDFHRRSVDAESSLRYASAVLQSVLTVSIGAETESRTLANRDRLPPSQSAQKGALLAQADYEQSAFTLQMRHLATLSPRLSAVLETTASVLRHDTPEANRDDRDEVFFNGQAGLQYRLHDALTMDIRVLGTSYHTVYLKAQRSAENNVQRSLRLRPSVYWSTSAGTRVHLLSEVRATYTVDDFVLEGRLPQDQSARELRYEGTFEQDLGARIRLLADGIYSDLRLGRFFQDRFAEIPFDTLRTYGGRLRLQVGRRVVPQLGFRFYIRTDYDRATTVAYDRLDDEGLILRDEAGNPIRTSITRPGRRWIEQVGPTASLDWTMSNGGRLRFEGWMNRQRIRYRLYGDLPEESAAHIRASARRGTRRYIPNLVVSITWPL
jgi:hypothetical protein